jgi:hypothetical protein
MLPTPAPRPPETSGKQDGTASSATGGVFDYISVITFQGYLTQRQILLNTNTMVKQLGSLINFFKDSSVRASQDQEEQNLDKPKPTSSNNGDGLVGAIKDGIGFITVKAAVLAIATAITLLSDEIQHTVRETVAYLTLARKQTFDAVKALPEVIVSTVEFAALTVGKVIGLALRTFGVTTEGFIKGIDFLLHSAVTEPFIKAFTTMFEIVGGIAKAVFSVVDVFLRPMLSLFEGIGKLGLSALELVAKGAGKIFLPLQILLSAIDFISGFIEGYERSGVEEGIKTGLVKVFDGLFIAVIDIAKKFVAWVLDYIGLDNLAKSLTRDVDLIIEDLRGVFKSIIEVFAGLVKFDGKQVWDGLKTGFTDLLSLIVHSVTGSINLVVNFFKDVFDLGDEPFDILKSDFVNSILETLKEFAKGVVEWLKDSLRSALTSVAGEGIANKVLGAKEVSEEDVNKKADQVARDRVTSSMSNVEKFAAQQDDYKHLKYEVTPDDVAQARKQLQDSGFKVDDNVKIDDQQFSKIEKILNDASKAPQTRGGDVNISNTRITNGGGGSRPVIVPIPMQEKASQSNPTRRSGN